MKKTVVFIVIAFLVFIGGCSSITYVVESNKEIKLRNQVIGQQDNCKDFYDNMFKSIAQVAQVTEAKKDAAKESFKEIYPALMEGRYSNDKGGALMKWVTESNPQFDINAALSLYDELARVIEEKRNEFFMEQKKLISYQQQHKNLVQTFPGSFFLDRDTIAITLITSAKTKEVYATGEENDIDVFQKK